VPGEQRTATPRMKRTAARCLMLDRPNPAAITPSLVLNSKSKKQPTTMSARCLFNFEHVVLHD
jgi:hypothetical protein